jgi:O-antigen ligase
VQISKDATRIQWDSDIANPLRKLAFFSALAYIWVRYSMMHEMITYITGVNPKIVYLLAPPTFIGIALSGGIRRTLQQRAAWYWIPLTLWMILAVPFSSWKGGSVDVVMGFLKAQIGLLFVMGGVAMTWKECRAIICTIALGAVFLIFTARIFLDFSDESRLSGFGTMGNSNDYAALLLLLLPFLLFVGLGPKQNLIFRVPALAAAIYGAYQIVATASRGAIVAIGVTALFVLWKGEPKLRVATAALIPLGAIVSIVLLPSTTLDRLASFSQNTSTQEASESAQSRVYLLRKSIEFTLEHPFFGVGPGQFQNFEGKTSREEGARGSWHSTHNVFTQVSSEYGLPGMILFVASLVGTFRILDESLREARRRSLQQVAFGVFCLMSSFIAFTTAAAFLNLAYAFYFPAFTGLAVTVYSAVRLDSELGFASGVNMASQAVGWGPHNAVQTPRMAPRARRQSKDLAATRAQRRTG